MQYKHFYHRMFYSMSTFIAMITLENSKKTDNFYIFKLIRVVGGGEESSNKSKSFYPLLVLQNCLQIVLRHNLYIS